MKIAEAESSAIKRIKELCPDIQLKFRINNNVNNLLTIVRNRKNGEIRLSLHKIFLEADDETLKGIAGFIRNPKREHRVVIRKFIAGHSIQIDRTIPKRRTMALNPVGRIYDLSKMFDNVNEQYFSGRLSNLKITYAPYRAHTRKRYKTINFGSFSYAERLIRIHPVLDNEFVPRYFVEYIIYHEMLHSVILPKIGKNGYTIYHNKEFKAREKEFLHYAVCERWQKENMKYLLKMVKKG